MTPCDFCFKIFDDVVMDLVYLGDGEHICYGCLEKRYADEQRAKVEKESKKIAESGRL